MTQMTQIFLASVCCLVLLPKTFGSIEEMTQISMMSQSAANERTARFNKFDRYSLHEIALNQKDLASNISKFLKEINKFIINTDSDENIQKLTNIVGISVFLITHSDDIYAAGYSLFGKLGFGHQYEVKEPKIIPELSGKEVIDIKCGNRHCVALTKTGKIYTFGDSSDGRTGNGYNDIIQKPIEISVDNQIITAIDCTDDSTYALTQSGQLYWFGSSYWSYNNEAYIPTKVVFPSEVEIKSISCGSGHILALTVDGKVFSWSLNDDGQLGLAHNNNTNSPQMISLNDAIKQVSCGKYHSLLLTTDGKVYSMGRNKYGQLGIGNRKKQNIPKLVLTEQKEICCQRDISMSLDKNNKLFVWGKINRTVVSPVLSELTSFQKVVNKYDFYYSTLKPDEIFVEKKQIEEYLQNIKNQNSSISITIERNEVLIINFLISDQLFKANDGLKYPELFSIDSNLLKKINRFIIHTNIFIGTSVFLITHSDDVYAFGRNYKGRLGFKHEKEVKEPTIIPELSGKKVIDIKCGYYHCVALTQSGQIYTFGSSHEGRTGNGDNDIIQKPIEISVDNQIIVAIDCTTKSTFVLTQSGQLYWFGYMWGSKIDYYPTKVMFPSEVKIKSISCGDEHILVLTEDGKVFSWGYNYYGQLGLGHNNAEGSPKIIELNENIKQIYCGYDHSLLLTTDGKIYSMGDNQYGQLGIGNNEKQNIPQLVLTDQKEICCYKYISMSLDVNNKLFVWGFINNGLVLPVISELTSFQAVVNKYAGFRSTLKPIELFNDEKHKEK